MRRTVKKSIPLSKLKKKLDAVFSVYIRQRDRCCITCGVKKPTKELQAGHYVSRRHNSLRYDERNVNGQCVACNVFKHGALDEYALKLKQKYGEGILEELNRVKHQTKQFTVNEILNLLNHYELLI